MKCKQCGPINGYELKQSGMEHPKSYICPVCDSYHSDKGELYDPERKKQEKPVSTIDDAETCPYCGSNEVYLTPYGFTTCYDCGAVF